MSARKKLILKQFREAVFERDGHKCRCCTRTDGLDAHHIHDRHEMPDGGYIASNGISLCPTCHLKAELFHSSGGLHSYRGYHPNDLTRLITCELTTKGNNNAYKEILAEKRRTTSSNTRKTGKT